MQEKLVYCKTRFLYLPTIYTPILTDNSPILLTMDTYVAAKGKVGHVTSSAFQSFSGFRIVITPLVSSNSSFDDQYLQKHNKVNPV
jgi:hypothetical protein